MDGNDHGDDERAIKAVIARQFASLSWTPEAPADWDGFAADFVAGATLYAAARPASSQTVHAFLERMKGLAGTTLRSLEETLLGTEIVVFGNVAVAVAACGMTENGTEAGHAVEMMLLVKTDGMWRIVSQAWDKASETSPLPYRLFDGMKSG